MGKVRQLPSGAFQCRWYESGRRREQIATGCTTQRQAEDYLNAIERRLLDKKTGIDRPTKEQKAQQSITVGELIEKFCAEYTRPKLKDVDKHRRYAACVLKPAKEAFGKIAASKLTRKQVADWRDGWLGKRSVSSVLGYMRFLRTAYNWGNDIGIINCPNPAGKGLEYPEAKHSLDYYSQDEIGRMLAYLESVNAANPTLKEVGASKVTSEVSPMLYPMFVVAVFQGLRKGELGGLRWSCVNFEMNMITVNRSFRSSTKSGNERPIPLNPTTARVLRMWRDRPNRPDYEGLVFPMLRGKGIKGLGLSDPAKGPGYRMLRADDMVGIKEALTAAGCHVGADPWHSCRHSFGTYCAARGVPLTTIQKWMGHRNLSTTMRYIQVAPETEHNEIARLDFSPAPCAAVLPFRAASR